jgi:hypothetical protein
MLLFNNLYFKVPQEKIGTPIFLFGRETSCHPKDKAMVKEV